MNSAAIQFPSAIKQTISTLGRWVPPKAGGDPIINTGSCVAGWQKINGEWKIVWELWNTEPLPQ